MTPTLNGIDHVHINVSDRTAAEAWYQSVLGFSRVVALLEFAEGAGPLTVADADGRIHLALFESDDGPRTSAIAFGSDGAGFLQWKSHLEAHGLELRIADHRLSYSLYFTDPWGNYHEITTYEHQYVADRLAGSAE
ncbi:MAG: VOC family protein [Woeseiaceae bacterium]|nr:VOC family protein [Woeseiaceae bacterium]